MPQASSATCRTDDSTVVIIANRGPHDFVRDNGHWVAKSAAGGLMSMIEPLARQPNVAWFCCVSEPPGSEAERDALYTTAKDQIDPELNVVPVPLPAAIYRDYYGAISNEVLWMLQHHLVGQFGYATLDHKRHEAWNNYLEASRRMADAVCATEIPVRAFFIQDYHLYPLSRLLRDRYPDVPSLHFIHLPFPDPALLKLLPNAWREALLRGLLGADVIGFQTPADVRAFLACCEELLGENVDYHAHTVTLAEQRTVRVRAYPTSTDPEPIRQLQQSPAVQAARDRLVSETREWNVVRVDRIDPSKNQVLGFTAFGRFLELHPELHGRVRFLACLIPSRTDVTVYRDYHHAVHAEIDAVNARFRDSCGFNPIALFYTNDRSVGIAAMELCDVLLVNSRQDGMNLVVKDWAIVSKRPGVLVLSETAGVAEELGESSLPVSPLDIEGTAEAIATGLLMPLDERTTRLDRCRQRIESWTARHWLEAQLRDIGIEPLPVPAAPVVEGAQQAIPSDIVELALEVLNRSGIHARPAAAFVRCAREFDCQIEIVREDSSFSAKSILEVLTANLNHGATFILRATGSDATAAIARLREVIARFEHEEE